MFTSRTRGNTRRLSAITRDVRLTSQPLKTVPVLGQRLVGTRIIIRQISNRFNFSLRTTQRREVNLSRNRQRDPMTNRGINSVNIRRTISKATGRAITRIIRKPLILLRMHKTRSITSRRIMTFRSFIRRNQHNINKVHVVAINRSVRIDVSIFRRNTGRITLTLTQLLTSGHTFTHHCLNNTINKIIIMCMRINVKRHHFRITRRLTSNSFLIMAEWRSNSKDIRALERIACCVFYVNLFR